MGQMEPRITIAKLSDAHVIGDALALLGKSTADVLTQIELLAGSVPKQLHLLVHIQELDMDLATALKTSRNAACVVAELLAEVTEIRGKLHADKALEESAGQAENSCGCGFCNGLQYTTPKD